MANIEGNNSTTSANIFGADASEQSGVNFLTIIHASLIILVVTHLFYFIFMLIKQNLYKGQKKEAPQKPENLRKINDCCSICLENIKYEVQMLCSHSYCASCIIDYGKQRYNFCEVQCPICRTDSKLMFANFERTEENKEYYDLILNYNHQVTSHYPTSFCFCLDMFRFSTVYLKQLTNFSNPRFERRRKVIIAFLLIVFIVVIYPLTLDFSNFFDLLEDLFCYLVLIISCAEFFYREVRNQTNEEFDRIHSSESQSSNNDRNVSNIQVEEQINAANA